jgi:hypothetical protein
MAGFYFLQNLEKHFRWLKNIPLLPQIVDEQLKVYTLLFRPVVFRKMIEIVALIKKNSEIKTTYHRFGGLEFGHNAREIGHLHGNGLMDILFNKKIRDKLIELHWAEPHHVNKNSGWVSIYVSKDSSVSVIFQIFNWAYQYHSQSLTEEEILTEIDSFLQKKEI